MAVIDSEKRDLVISVSQKWTRDAELGLNNLLLHRGRSLLTMLGMIFGVAAVVAMLSIGAGAPPEGDGAHRTDGRAQSDRRSQGNT